MLNPQREHSGTPRSLRKRVASLSKSATLILCRSAGLTGVREMSNRFTQYILGAMVLGIIMGSLIFNFLPDSRVELAGDINLIAMLFLRLIKMKIGRASCRERVS